MIDRAVLAAAVHDTPTMLVLAVTGGGVGVVNDLLAVPGASRTVLEVVVPYAARSLAEWIGSEPQQATNAATAAAMAVAAWRRAGALAPGADVVGVGVTAALASDRPKRGDHRAHVAVAHGYEEAEVWSLTLDKGKRDRATEDRLVADLALVLIAGASGLAATLAGASGLAATLDLGLAATLDLGPGDALSGPS